MDPIVEQITRARLAEASGKPSAASDESASAPGETQSAPGESVSAAVEAPGETPDMEQQRRDALAIDTLMFALQQLPMPEVAISEEVVPVPDFPDVRVRIYRPAATADESEGKPLPVLVQFYGGAFRQGGIDYPNFDYMYRSRAEQGRVAVVAVDYAKAPENRFPTPVRQGIAVVHWITDNADRLGFDNDRIAVGGQSSGGNIAASVVNYCAANPDAPRLRMQILEVPILELSSAHKDFTAFAPFEVPRQALEAEVDGVATDYLGALDPRLVEDPEASPLRASSLRGVPETYLLLAQNDMLRGDGEAYLDRLRADGVPAAGLVVLGQSHESMSWLGWLAAARALQATINGLLLMLHGEPQPYVQPPSTWPPNPADGA